MRNPAAVCPLGPLLSLPKLPLVFKAQLSLSLPSQTPTNGSSSLLAAVAQCLTRAAQGGKGSILTHSLQPSWLKRNTGEIGSSCSRYSRWLVTVPQVRQRRWVPVLCWLLPFSLCCTMVPLTIREPLSSLRLLWKGPHRHTQKCVSQVTSNQVMVTVEIIVISVIVFSNFKPVSHISQPFSHHISFTLNILPLVPLNGPAPCNGWFSKITDLWSLHVLSLSVGLQTSLWSVTCKWHD